MHPTMLQQLAAEHIKDQLAAAHNARRARQVHGRKCRCRARRAAVDRPGPLTWIPGFDGPRLAGTWLLAPDTAGPGR